MMKNHKKSEEKDRKLVNILGISLLSTDKAQLLSSIEEKITHNSQISILTPNPELILASKGDKNLKKVVNSADFNVPDGVGLKYASIFLYRRPLNIIPGRLLFNDLIKLADKNSWRVFFLGGLGNEAGLAEKETRKKYKNLKIMSYKGPKLTINGKPVAEVDRSMHIDAVKEINRFKPHLLFVAFGNPKQEFWISENLESLSVNAAMAVGGTFRYITNLSALPPRSFQLLGLEWLWRLVTEPDRVGRVAKAVVLFPLTVLMWKLGFKVSSD
jgi:N-acetylglucosaminyldiphosphoundecaprenol N-acetyl-beta-D-mannosaminyltransferase